MCRLRDIFERLPAIGAEPLEARELRLGGHAVGCGLPDHAEAEVTCARDPARHPRGVGIKPQHNLRAAVRHVLGEAGCEGLRTHRTTAVTMGMVNRDRTVVTATQPASRLTGRR